MSFGFSVGDFLAVGNLAWDLYRVCKGMSEEYFEISREALAIHTVIKELQDEADDPQSVLNRRGNSRRGELLGLVENLQQVLQNVDFQVQKYKGLARRERRIWNQLRMSKENLGKLKPELILHLAAINTFMASLSRGTEARIETVLLEFVKDCREGRVMPNVMSVDEVNNAAGWRALERELTEEGISGEDVSAHKTAIKVFLLGRLKDDSADNVSFDEVASIVESSYDQVSIAESLHDLSFLPGRLSRAPTVSSVDRTSLITADSVQTYQTASESLAETNEIPATATAMRVTFAPSTNLAGQADRERNLREEIDPRLLKAAAAESGGRSIYRYRHSLDVSHLGPARARPAHMVLIIDRTHSCVSKLAHAYLRSITKTDNLVGDYIDTVRSTGWRMIEGGGVELLKIESWTKELLSSRKIEIPPANTVSIQAFRFQDLLQFDHIICLNSPTFLNYLEENIRKITKIKYSAGEYEDQSFARLTQFELPAGLQLPELMQRAYPSLPEMFERRQKLALEEIFKAVKRFVLEFLNSEYGFRKKGQGFEKVVSRRPSRSNSLKSLDRITSGGSSTSHDV